ncbi:ABC transporter ATP-binding protein [Streptomyces sp. SID12501]|uniref:ABC transporter ATP-binding protein n=1 Tax=Streptomyces sp. SID12501 TaxID=2706042 RepID=A0A6B3C6U9_9ACTN|nr:ABC transporter ATP-binding protein [Streptomyces sp. SID12501]NEC92537.1 ABC transporter ATP-binding protein [Streptomyces sp. SID12501]
MTESATASGPATASPPVIEFRGVGLTYPGPPPVPALRPCDLTVLTGDYVTVVGPSGSGKSTFLNIAGLLDRPTSGRYLLDGVDTGAVRDAGRTALRGQRIGFVFQSFHLLSHRSALENVTLALLYNGTPRRNRAARAREALERVGLGHRLDAVPSRLSGGERQRVAIARAVVARPSLLLCDEPTGNLDTVTAESVLSLLDQLHGEGMTLLVITHDREVAARGRRTITIRDGVLRENSLTENDAVPEGNREAREDTQDTESGVRK